MTELTPVQRRELRAQAHHLNPVVSIAGNGLTPTVLEEIDHSLQAHELIKIKVHGAERDVRESFLSALCEALGAAPVQHIGTILVVWRKRREDGSKARPGAEKPAGNKRLSKAKSAGAFAAAARIATFRQEAANKKRRTTALRSGGFKKPGTRSAG